MNSISTTIRKSISVLIGLLSVTVLTLSSSFSAFVQPSNIVSPMQEPVANSSISNGIKTTVYYVVIYLDGAFGSWGPYNGKYLLFRHEVKCPSSTEFVIANWIQSAGYPIFSNNQNLEWSYSFFDIESGNLLGEVNIDAPTTSYNWGPYSNNYIINFTGFSYFPYGSARYYINGDTEVYGTSGTYTVEPFVTWNKSAFDVVQYRSPLSEPVSDKHNAYFVVNEFLYWVSYRINTIYELQNSIEGNTETYSGSGSYSEENSIVYRENSTIQWQNEFGAGNTFQGSFVNPNNEQFVGYVSDLYENSYGLGVIMGDGTYSYNGQVYVPASISSAVYSEPYELCITTLNNKSLSIDFLRHSSLNTDILVDADVYLSIFKIEDGSYVKSEIKNVQGAYSKIGWTATFDTEHTIDSVRMYGPAFINTAEIPVNLSSVLWEYDIDFAQWRDRLENMLTNIYKALTGEMIETETYTQPSWNDELNEAEPDSYISQDEMISVFDSGFDDIKPSPENEISITEWVDMFSIPKLIAACCFALAMGTIILTLGKKKSD